jgi:hypothetical protein
MASEDYGDQAAKALESLDQRETRRVSVVGRVVEGRLEIDMASIEEFKRNFPDASLTFLAVNAPFDPTQSPVTLVS